jgi:hypothetical protein
MRFHFVCRSDHQPVQQAAFIVLEGRAQGGKFLKQPFKSLILFDVHRSFSFFMGDVLV